jgi:hypothetical protein
VFSTVTGQDGPGVNAIYPARALLLEKFNRHFATPAILRSGANQQLRGLSIALIRLINTPLAALNQNLSPLG